MGEPGRQWLINRLKMPVILVILFTFVSRVPSVLLPTGCVRKTHKPIVGMFQCYNSLLRKICAANFEIVLYLDQQTDIF